MKKLQRILRPIGVALAVIGVMLALGFVERTADRTTISDLEVIVEGSEGLHFINERSIRQEVLDQGAAVMGSATGKLDVTAIEERLKRIPSVAQAEVYHTMDGRLHARVEQRQPIVRVFDRDGSSYYIDRNGWTMPTSDDYTARVLVVTGDIEAAGDTGAVRNVHAATDRGQRRRAGDIHRLAMFITSDPFWNALVDQVVVTKDGEFELIPRIGGQRILLGDGGELPQRFEKLRIFYEQGIPQAGWRNYARIDLRYADQVVCTKRTTP